MQIWPGTKALLAEQPSLLNATWDWGGGDFEMGIGGAGHMGNREIAEYLISQGGRFDIFVAAMLGKLEIVRSLLAAWPALLNSKGPHGTPADASRACRRRAGEGGCGVPEDFGSCIADLVSFQLSVSSSKGPRGGSTRPSPF